MISIDPDFVDARRRRVRGAIDPAEHIRLILPTRGCRHAAHGGLAARSSVEASAPRFQLIVFWLPGQHHPSPCVALSDDRAQT
jgi:hypothetical protein